MLSEPPNARDLRALAELLTTQRETGVGDEQRARLRAMAVIVGPPYELTARGRTLVAAVLSLMLFACGGDPFELAPPLGPDTGAVAVEATSPLDAGAGDALRHVDGLSPEGAADVASSRDVAGDGGPVDVRSADVATVDQVGPDASPSPDVALRDIVTADVVDSSAPPDASSSPPDAPSCSSSQSFSFQTGPTGCMCETPETYSCYAWGVVCGTCPPDVDGSAFGHADGSCATPNVCKVGAPCAWQSPGGAVVAGSVIACP